MTAACVRTLVTIILSAQLIFCSESQVQVLVGSTDTTIRWSTIDGHRYRVFKSDNLQQWADLTETMEADGTEMEVATPKRSQQFFAVVDMTETGGWLAAKTQNENADMVAGHENGDWLTIDTSRDPEGKLGTIKSVTYLADGTEPIRLTVDTQGRPSRMYAYGEMVQFHRFDSTTGQVTLSHHDTNGNLTEQFTIDYPEVTIPSYDNTQPIEDESGLDFGESLKAAGNSLAVAGCVTSVALTIATSGAGWPFMALSCASFAVNVLRNADEEKGEAWGLAGFFIDATTCVFDINIVTKPLACASAAVGTAELIQGQFEVYEDQHAFELLISDARANSCPDLWSANGEPRAYTQVTFSSPEQALALSGEYLSDFGYQAWAYHVYQQDPEATSHSECSWIYWGTSYEWHPAGWTPSDSFTPYSF